MLHGCLPAIIMDGVQEKFESLLDYESFSVRIPEADLERVSGSPLQAGTGAHECLPAEAW